MEAEYLVLLVVAVATVAFAFMMLRKPAPAVDASTTAAKKAAKLASPTAAGTAGAPGTPSSDKKLPMVVYFASQSGTAETYAVELAEQAKVQGFNARVVDLEEFDEDEFPTDTFVVFLAATFGEGEPPDNTQRFWEWIRNKDRDPMLCKEMNFACFALGNRQYEHFCAVGRTIDERMRSLGARAVCELGEGDDDGSLEDDYNAWKARFWPAARAHFGLAAATGASGGAALDEFKSTVNCIMYALPGDKTKIQDELFSLEVGGRVVADEDKKLPPPPPYVGGLLAFQRYSDPKHKADTITCTVNKELRQVSTELATTRHLEFALPRGCRLKYSTSHNLGVFPRNDYKLSARLAARLRVDTRTIFKLEKKPGNRKLPLPMAVCSVQDALLWYCDFMCVTRAKTLKILAQYATDDADKARLLHWANEGKEEFHKESMNLLEVLEQVPSVHPPWSEFIEWCPKLQPRFYTISSSNRVHPESLHLTVAMTVEELPGGRRHLGVCSSYLANLRPDKDSICAFVRKSTFDLPKVPNTPVIMVGPGTGVAPFRGFWQEIRWHREQAEKKLEAIVASAVAGSPKPDLKSPTTGKEPYRVGPAILFFGCRNADEDFLYKDEMSDEKSTGVELVTAFSRERKEAKMYVQHRIIEQGERIWTLLQRGAVFYTCGGTGMGREVRAALQTVVERHGAMSPEQAHAYVELMQKSTPQRFIQELWS